jgi:hypothetical protein
MGYYMTVEDFLLNSNGLSKLPEGITPDFWALDEEDPSFVVIKEEDFNWADGWFIEDLKALAKAGVTGEVVLSGELGEWYKYVLKGGRVEEYEGSVVFPKEPTEIYE